MHLNRCSVFWLWAGVGGALTLSVISFVGVLVGLPALVALWLVARRSPRWPEPLGLLTGAGALCLVVALLNWDELGVDPVPWLLAGIVLGAAGIGFYARARRA